MALPAADRVAYRVNLTRRLGGYPSSVSLLTKWWGVPQRVQEICSPTVSTRLSPLADGSLLQQKAPGRAPHIQIESPFAEPVRYVLFQGLDLLIHDHLERAGIQR